MRKIVLIAAVFSLLLLTLPLVAVTKQKEVVAVQKGGIYAETYKKAEKEESFRVLLHDSGKIEKMSSEDYVFGVVAAEMPALYETEALKAQAVAAYSFACLRKAQNANKDYDISTDASLDQSYISEADALKKWGQDGEKYVKKIRSAVKSVKGQTVNYNGSIALTLYHAVSCGKTENCAEIWGGEYEYLTSADSVWDKLSPNYLSSQTFTFDEINSMLGGEYAFSQRDIKIQTTKIGTVKTVTVAKKEISGETLREKLKLRSLNFTVNVTDGGVTFEVKGYGHGVGMSQYGADYMAKQGADYKEILKHYYKNTTVG